MDSTPTPSRKAALERVEREPVTSSHILSLGYSPADRVFAIEFKDGSIFHYRGVEPWAWEEINRAESKGSAFHHVIRGKYTADKMTGECPKCGDAPGIVGEPCKDCGCDVYEVDCGALKPLHHPPLRCNAPRRHEAFNHSHTNPRWTRGPESWAPAPATEEVNA